MDQPTQATLHQIFTARAVAVLAGTGQHNASWQKADGAGRLAEALLDTCAKIKVRP
jgi:hypothetical protein